MGISIQWHLIHDELMRRGRLGEIFPGIAADLQIGEEAARTRWNKHSTPADQQERVRARVAARRKRGGYAYHKSPRTPQDTRPERYESPVPPAMGPEPFTASAFTEMQFKPSIGKVSSPELGHSPYGCSAATACS